MGFILELDPTGSTAILSIIGFGGNRVALDVQGNIYAVGTFSDPVPTTAGAFQTSARESVCYSGFIIPRGNCSHQHIAKIDPTGTQLIYGTYLTGKYGASPSAIAVDTGGNVFVAGSTSSPDYPTTPSAYQPRYLFYPEPGFAPIASSFPPSPAGYVTKLNTSGTGLIWSTFFSGSAQQITGGYPVNSDVITGLALDQNGNVLLSGSAQSIDLPGLWMTPVVSRPTLNLSHPMAFVTRLSPDGVRLSPTQLMNGYATGITVRADGSAVIVPQLAAVTLSDPPRVASITDLDNTRVMQVAPGQLLTLYGTGLVPVQTGQPSGQFPPSLNGVTVTFNGIPAPILYAGGEQINLQVPYEIAGQNEVTMQVTSEFASPPVSESFILGVVARMPSALPSPNIFKGPLYAVTTCNGTNVFGFQPYALNADGTVNSCDNPAPSGSTVTIFLNGMGVTSPALATGAISNSLLSLSPAAQIGANITTPANVVATDTAPGSITGLAQVQIQVSAGAPFVSVPLEVGQAVGLGYLLRGLQVIIWTETSGQ